MSERVPIRTALGTADEGYIGYDFRTELCPAFDTLLAEGGFDYIVSLDYRILIRRDGGVGHFEQGRPCPFDALRRMLEDAKLYERPFMVAISLQASKHLEFLLEEGQLTLEKITPRPGPTPRSSRLLGYDVCSPRYHSEIFSEPVTLAPKLAVPRELLNQNALFASLSHAQEWADSNCALAFGIHQIDEV